MRGPAIISAILHLGFAILMVTGLPTFFQAPKPKPPVIVPVDLVVIADETKVPTKKEKKAEQKKDTKKEKPKPKAEPKRVADPKPEPPKPVKKERVPPPLKQVKKEPPKPEKKVAKKEEAKPNPTPATTPRVKPKPPAPKKVEKKKKKEPEFNETRIAALLDKLAKSQPEAEVAEKDEKKKAPESKSNQRISLADQATATEKDFLQQQIQNCWSIPSGVPYSDDLFAVVTVRLNPDGTYAGPLRVDNPTRMNQPGQHFYRTFVESAVRAIQKCEPLKMPVRNGVPFVPKEDVEFAFDPRKLLGG